MINSNNNCKSVSRNANSRNKRKVINGFKGEGTPSNWVKTSPYGTITHEKTLDEIRHSNKIKKFKKINRNSKHAGSKRTLNYY